MSIAHHRKKQPQEVRKQLLDKATDVAVSLGLGALTLDTVAREAGVSKGGLLHHFPNKRALLDALCDDILEHLDQAIAAAMARDPVESGRFSRAYLEVMSNRKTRDHQRHWALLSIMLLLEPDMRKRWRRWLESHMPAASPDAPSNGTDRLVRLAADGLWLSDLVDGPDSRPRARKALVASLHELSLHTP